MTAYTTRMPSGIPGAISRSDPTVEAQLFDSANPFLAYGQFGKTVAGLFRPLVASDAATVITGMLVRPYPAHSGQDALGTSTPPTSGICNRLRRGYMTVLLKIGTAAKDGQVYVVTTAGGTVVVNDICTAASPAGGGTAVAVANCFFTGPADANGNVEVAFNI